MASGERFPVVLFRRKERTVETETMQIDPFKSTYGRLPGALRRSNGSNDGERVPEFLLAYPYPIRSSSCREACTRAPDVRS